MKWAAPHLLSMDWKGGLTPGPHEECFSKLIGIESSWRSWVFPGKRDWISPFLSKFPIGHPKVKFVDWRIQLTNLNKRRNLSNGGLWIYPQELTENLRKESNTIINDLKAEVFLALEKVIERSFGDSRFVEISCCRCCWNPSGCMIFLHCNDEFLLCILFHKSHT